MQPDRSFRELSDYTLLMFHSSTTLFLQLELSVFLVWNLPVHVLGLSKAPLLQSWEKMLLFS